jgi:hypothetical protein
MDPSRRAQHSSLVFKFPNIAEINFKRPHHSGTASFQMQMSMNRMGRLT